jgi:hypothetical protein
MHAGFFSITMLLLPPIRCVTPTADTAATAVTSPTIEIIVE